MVILHLVMPIRITVSFGGEITSLIPTTDDSHDLGSEDKNGKIYF